MNTSKHDLYRQLERIRRSKKLHEGEETENQLSEQELAEEIKKFNDGVAFSPKGSFGAFVKNPTMIQWGGLLDGRIYWNFTVTGSSESTTCQIQLQEALPLDDETILLLQRLQAYFKVFFDYWKNEL